MIEQATPAEHNPEHADATDPEIFVAPPLGTAHTSAPATPVVAPLSQSAQTTEEASPAAVAPAAVAPQPAPTSTPAPAAAQAAAPPQQAAAPAPQPVAPPLQVAPPPSTPHTAAQPHGAHAAPAAPRPSTSTRLGDTNTYAFLSIILAFFFPIGGVVFGHIALSQIKKTGDAGRGIATAGTIIGYTLIALYALLIVFYMVSVILWVARGFPVLSEYA